MATIPEEVLVKIGRQHPHLRFMIQNLRDYPEYTRLMEKRIADAYLLGQTTLTGQETWALSFCSRGEPYGGQASRHCAVSTCRAPVEEISADGETAYCARHWRETTNEGRP